MEVLISIGVSPEHIPNITRNLDDIANPDGKKKKPGNDSSIEEPDLDADLAHLDEFESLFRVHTAAKVPDSEEQKKNGVGEFKISRKAAMGGANEPSSNLKVKVSGGLPDTLMRDEDRNTEKTGALAGISALKQAATLREQRRL